MKMYTHEEVIDLCNKAKRDQRHDCAEAILLLDHCNASHNNAVYNEYGEIVDVVSVDAAHQCCMNAGDKAISDKR